MNVTIGEEAIREIKSRVANGQYNFAESASRSHGRLYPEDVAAAIFQYAGHLGNIANALGCERHKVKSYIQRSPFFSMLLENEDETLVDDAKDVIVEYVREKRNPHFAGMILKTLGKDRGFSTRVENTGKDGGPIKTENSDPRQQLKDVLSEIDSKEKEEKLDDGND